MAQSVPIDLYSAREISRAAGVPVQLAIDAIGRADRLVSHADAVSLARLLRQGITSRPAEPFSVFRSTLPTHRGSVTLALSATLHGFAIATLVLVTSLSLDSSITAAPETPPADKTRLVFLALPGPGGGGGGGGLRQKAPPPKALREGERRISSPLPARRPPPAVEPVVKPPEPTPPPLRAEALPPIVAPVVTAPADHRDQIGILEEARSTTDSKGPGTGAGVGTGTGTGIGEGRGAGIGPGSGGGTGGGPFRPGSGIDPPRLLSEVKPEYTEDARRRGIEGAVEMEIVVRSDGSVGDVRILKGLAAGLNDRAINAVRQWRFSPARRQGTPVDVIVEVSVEFRMR